MVTEPGAKDTKRRRRRLRAALVLLRRRITKACNQMKSAGGFYDDMSKNLGPILSEFGDVLPEGARESLSRVNALVQDRRADLDTACKMCKGEVKSAIKDVSSRLGVEGKIREALEPLENLAPGWLVASPVAQGVVAVLVVLAGGGTVAAVGGAAISGGAEESTNQPPGFAASPGGASTDTDLPDPCELFTATAASGPLRGEVEVEASDSDSERACTYLPARAGAAACEKLELRVLTEPPFSSTAGLEPINDFTDEAYYADPVIGHVYAREGDLWFESYAWSQPTDCDRDSARAQVEIPRLRAQATYMITQSILKLRSQP